MDALAALLEQRGHRMLGRASRPRRSGWSRRSSSAMAISRRAWPRPIGGDRYSARLGATPL